MKTQLDRDCTDVLHSSSLSELLGKMVKFSQDRGFWHVSATIMMEHSPALREYQFLTNSTVDYMPEFEDLESARMDPVSQHAVARSTPIVWNRDTYQRAGQDALWERQAPYGYRSGIGIGFHLPRGRHFLLGPDSDSDICVPRRHTADILEDFHQFAAHAQAAAFELCWGYDPPIHELPSPQPSELEALRWSMDGLTDQEIGGRMKLSEWDVKRRLQRLMRKWGCGTKYEAVLMGIKLGLIQCP
jgi:DNA-binding CsgD family transcriptional regulator